MSSDSGCIQGRKRKEIGRVVRLQRYIYRNNQSLSAGCCRKALMIWSKSEILSLFQCNRQIFINADRNGICERIFVYFLLLLVRIEAVYRNAVAVRIDQAVFAHAFRPVFKQLKQGIPAAAGGGNNFHHPVRSSIAAILMNLRGITDNHKIRLQIIPLLIQIHGKRRLHDHTLAMIILNIVSQLQMGSADQSLVPETRRCHHIDSSVNQLCALSLRKSKNIINGSFCFFRERHKCLLPV